MSFQLKWTIRMKTTEATTDLTLIINFYRFRGAYVNVARYRKWIDTEMQKMKLDTSSYIHA